MGVYETERIVGFLRVVSSKVPQNFPLETDKRGPWHATQIVDTGTHIKVIKIEGPVMSSPKSILYSQVNKEFAGRLIFSSEKEDKLQGRLFFGRWMTPFCLPGHKKTVPAKDASLVF